MKNLLISFVLLCVAAGPLQAQDVYQWFGTDPVRTGPPTDDWDAGYAWMTEIGPGGPGTYCYIPDEHAKIKINNIQWGTNWEQYMPVIRRSVTVGDIFIAEGGAALSPAWLTVASTGTLLVQGAGGTAEGQINLGYQTGAYGGFYVNGTATVLGPVHVGWGGSGFVNINGGTLNVFAIDIGGNLGTGTIAVNGGGQLIVRGFAGDQLQEYVNAGLLTANGSAANVVITYDETNDRTIVTPEPASIALFGLGLAFLKKRK